jgi:hypothetical protein
VARKLIVEIVGDASSLERAFARSNRSAKRFQNDMSKTTRRANVSFVGLGNSIAGVSTALLGGAGLAYALHSVFEETKLVQQVGAQTRAVLDSTGSVAGVSARHVNQLAKRMAKLSGESSTVVRSGENLMLTFTNVRNVVGDNNDIFDQATLAAADMSAALGKDFPAAAKTLGKALQNPIRGVSTLRRANVSFTKAQEATIKSLVESGRMLEAQKLILRQVELAYGGSAAAAGDTFAGKVNRLRNSLLELGVTVGTQLLPVVTPLVDKMVAWLEKPKNKKKVIDETTTAIEGMTTAFEGLGSVIDTIVTDKGKIDAFFERMHLGFLNKGALRRSDFEELGLIDPKKKPGFRPPGLRGPTSGRTRRGGARAPGAAEAAAAAAAAKAAAGLAAKARRARLRQAAEAARQAVQDRAAFNVEKTGATKTLKDDLAALRHYNALLTRRIKGGHGTLELEREQFHVQMQIADVLKQQADLAKKTKKRLGVDVTRFQASARGQLVTAGTHGGGRGVVISGGVHLHGIQNVGQLENELTRRSKQRAHHRRGRR